MSTYLKLSTMEYPRFEGDIRLDYPEITEDQTGDTFPCPADYVVVTEVPCPAFDGATQAAIQLMPQQIDGVWTMVWEIKNYTQDQIDAIYAANEEDRLRRESQMDLNSFTEQP